MIGYHRRIALSERCALNALSQDDDAAVYYEMSVRLPFAAAVNTSVRTTTDMLSGGLKIIIKQEQALLFKVTKCLTIRGNIFIVIS
jgi:hypothetical protein